MLLEICENGRENYRLVLFINVEMILYKMLERISSKWEDFRLWLNVINIILGNKLF